MSQFPEYRSGRRWCERCGRTTFQYAALHGGSVVIWRCFSCVNSSMELDVMATPRLRERELERRLGRWRQS